MNVKKSRNGNTRYVRCKIEDASGLVECLMWPDDFIKFKDDFIDDRILCMHGGLSPELSKLESINAIERPT